MDNERLNTTPAKDARSEVANVDACGLSVEERRRIALEGDTHGKNKWAILFTVLVMTFMSTLDSSIVNVALPVMQKALAVSLSDIQWVSTVYLVAICASMLIFGRLGDMFGKVWLFQAGVALFAIGSLLCGLSHAFAMLLVSRCVQGIGAAAAMANNMGIITESFPAKERGRALGLLASFVALGMMCGPVPARSCLRWFCCCARSPLWAREPPSRSQACCWPACCSWRCLFTLSFMRNSRLRA